MDIGKFLTTGKTYVSTASNGLLRKIGGALIMSMALSAGAAEAGQRVGLVADMAPPTDALSSFYQSLAAPGSDRLIFVSTRSADFARIVNQMPEALAKRYSSLGGSLSDPDGHFDFEGVSVASDAAFAMSLKGHTLWDRLQGKEQGVVFVNAVEAILDGVKSTPSGAAYMEFDIEYGLPSVQRAEDSLHFVTIHELYHGAATTHFISTAAPDAPAAEVLYRGAVDEALADLAAVLDYARLEGTFANAMVVAKGLRCTGLVNADHNSEDMLEHIVAHLSPEQFKGMSTTDVFQVVNQIAEELDPMNNQQLKELFVRSALEKAALSDKLYFDQPPTLTAERIEMFSDPLGIAPPQIDPATRASKTLDAMITAAVRSKELYRELGIYNLRSLSVLAEKWGVELPVYQQARIAVFDAEISPPGSSHASPVENDNTLMASNHMGRMLDDYAQRFNVEIRNQGPSMR